MRLAIQERRTLITRDADFTDQTLYPPGQYPGIVRLDIHPPHLGRIAPALTEFLKSVCAERLAGRLFVVGETGYEEFT